MLKQAIAALVIFVYGSIGISGCNRKSDQARNNDASNNSNNSYSPIKLRAANAARTQPLLELIVTPSSCLKLTWPARNKMV